MFGFFRAISNVDEVANSSEGKAFIEADLDLRQRQQDLKARLKQRLPGNIHEYQAQWQDGGLSTNHIGTLPPTLDDCLKLNDAGKEPKTLCEAVWLRLSQVILAEAGKLESVEPLQREQDAHHEFGRERARLFVGREDILTRIADYLAGSDNHPLAVWGESGSGKSALMARAVQQAEDNPKPAVILSRFIGATPESSNGRALLESLCRQITRAYGGDDGTIPLEYRDLVQEFIKRLALASAQRPLVLFLDALDQLSDSDNARNLIWLPAELPPHVRLVVSTLPGECQAALQKRLPGSSLMPVPALSKLSGQSLLHCWLDEAQRTVTDEQQADILAKFERGGGLPLYLKLAFEEARHWHACDGLPALADQVPGLSEDTPGVISDLFWRLEQESNHGRVLVSHALGYLAAARNGLSEDELLDVLWQDDEVRSDFFRRSPKSPQDIAALPVVIWARLFLDLEPYLAHRKADGAELMGFYHRQVAEVAQADYLSRERYTGLAGYFTPKRLYLDEDEQAPNLRKLSEMVYQQALAGLSAGVEKTLFDFAYLQAKLAGQGIQELVEDYTLVPVAGVAGSKAKSLSLLEGALRLSAHVLGRNPSQLPGQLTGRLLARAEPEVAGLLNQARSHTREPWLRPVSPCLDSPAGPLIRTMLEHGDRVRSVAVTEDGKWAVSGSDDESVKVWDLATGSCIRTLAVNSGQVFAVALTPDGRLAVSGSSKAPFNTTFHLWDLATGACLCTHNEQYRWVDTVAMTPDGKWALISGPERHTLSLWDLGNGYRPLTLRGHGDRITSVVFLQDGKRAVSVSLDGALKLWDLESGRCQRTLRGHVEGVTSVAVTKDGRRAVSGSSDKCVRVWDLTNGACLAILEGHIDAVKAVALTSDGQRAISASSDKTLRVWDLNKKTTLQTLKGHMSTVQSVAMTPDGSRAVSGSWDATLKLWDLTGAEPSADPTGHTDRITALAATRDGKRLISGSADKTLKVWALENGAFLGMLQGHNAGVNTVGVSPDGRRAVSGSFDGALNLWDLDTGACLRHLSLAAADMTAARSNIRGIIERQDAIGPEDLAAALSSGAGKVSKVVVTPDGRWAMSGSSDGAIKMWDLASGACLKTLNGHNEKVAALALTPDGCRAVSGSWDHTLKVWDPATGTCLRTLEGHADRISAVVATQDGRLAVSSSADATLKVWELDNGTCLHTLRGHTGEVEAVAVTPDGLQAVSGSIDGTVRAWDLASGTCLFTLLGHSQGITATPDSMRAMEGSNEAALKFQAILTDVGMPTLEWPSQAVTEVAVMPGHGHAVSASLDRTITVWNLSNGVTLAAFHMEAGCTHFAVSPDGVTIAAGDRGGRLYFLRLENMVSGASKAATEPQGSSHDSLPSPSPWPSGMTGSTVPFQPSTLSRLEPSTTDPEPSGTQVMLAQVILALAVDTLAFAGAMGLQYHSWRSFWISLAPALIVALGLWSGLVRMRRQDRWFPAIGLLLSYGFAWGIVGWAVGKAVSLPGAWPLALAVSAGVVSMWIRVMLIEKLNMIDSAVR